MCAEKLMLKNLSMLYKHNTSVDKDAQSRSSLAATGKSLWLVMTGQNWPAQKKTGKQRIVDG